MKPSPVRDYFRVRPGYWFKPKRYGFGAIPATWQGWLASALLVGIAAALANFAQHGHPAFRALLVPLVLGFLWLCWAKTDGGWHWRWGNPD
jgi:hypothetical protein